MKLELLENRQLLDGAMPSDDGESPCVSVWVIALLNASIVPFVTAITLALLDFDQPTCLASHKALKWTGGAVLSATIALGFPLITAEANEAYSEDGVSCKESSQWKGFGTEFTYGLGGGLVGDAVAAVAWVGYQAVKRYKHARYTEIAA